MTQAKTFNQVLKVIEAMWLLEVQTQHIWVPETKRDRWMAAIVKSGIPTSTNGAFRDGQRGFSVHLPTTYHNPYNYSKVMDK